MGKTVLEKIADGEELTKAEVGCSVAMHRVNFKELLNTFENDMKNFESSKDDRTKYRGKYFSNILEILPPQ